MMASWHWLQTNPALLPIMRAAMFVILDALGERNSRADALAVEEAIEVDPLSAILRPRPAAKGFRKPRGKDFGFKLSQVFAGHG